MALTKITSNMASLDTLTANNGVLELDDNGSHNGIINVPASLSINIDSDNGATTETFSIAKDKTGINDTDVLFRVNEAGNVMIGTTTESGKLNVNGSINFLGRIRPSGTAGNGTATAPSICPGYDNDSGWFQPTSNVLALSTLGSEAMRINSSQHLLITGGDSNDRGGRLQVYGKTTTSASTFRVGTNGYPAINFLNESASQHGYTTVNSSSVSYTSVSDYRLKENVVTDWDATTRLKQLRPSRFNFIANANTTVDGFLAHEVSDIVPEAVTGAKDATETYTDEDGNEQTRPVYQGIDQAKLVPLLVKTIQELEARITTLENA